MPVEESRKCSCTPGQQQGLHVSAPVFASDARTSLLIGRQHGDPVVVGCHDRRMTYDDQTWHEDSLDELGIEDLAAAGTHIGMYFAWAHSGLVADAVPFHNRAGRRSCVR